MLNNSTNEKYIKNWGSIMNINYLQIDIEAVITSYNQGSMIL